MSEDPIMYAAESAIGLFTEYSNLTNVRDAEVSETSNMSTNVMTGINNALQDLQIKLQKDIKTGGKSQSNRITSDNSLIQMADAETNSISSQMRVVTDESGQELDQERNNSTGVLSLVNVLQESWKAMMSIGASWGSI